MLDSMTPQIILGFDFGMKRIGLALGNTITQQARPLMTLKAQDGKPNWDAVRGLIKQWGVEAMVVGTPYRLDGGTQEITLAAKKFARRLHALFRLPVHEIDERLTTREAKIEMKKQDGQTQHGIDSIAATLILESWLRKQT